MHVKALSQMVMKKKLRLMLAMADGVDNTELIFAMEALEDSIIGVKGESWTNWDSNLSYYVISRN